MKRDMDLIRQILIALKETPSGFFCGDLQFDGYSDSQIGYHSYLLCDSGLAHGVDVTVIDNDGPYWKVTRLTWAGHEFLEAARPPTRWNEVKSIMGRIGGAAFAVWQKVLSEQAEQAARNLIS